MNVARPLPLLLDADDPAGSGGVAARPEGSVAEILAQIWQASADMLERGEGIEIPTDELHREILLPLLPAMLRDPAIQLHWREHAATGFRARWQAYLDGRGAAPDWRPEDFEIHVTASYLAGPDAKALADTLLSEESLRTLSADLLNQVLAVVWPKLPLAAEEETMATGPSSPASLPAAGPPQTKTPVCGVACVEPTRTSIRRIHVKSSFEIARQLARLPKPRPVRRPPLSCARRSPRRSHGPDCCAGLCQQRKRPAFWFHQSAERI